MKIQPQAQHIQPNRLLAVREVLIFEIQVSAIIIM